eukprot:609808_1
MSIARATKHSYIKQVLYIAPQAEESDGSQMDGVFFDHIKQVFNIELFFNGLWMSKMMKQVFIWRQMIDQQCFVLQPIFQQFSCFGSRQKAHHLVGSDFFLTGYKCYFYKQ